MNHAMKCEREGSAPVFLVISRSRFYYASSSFLILRSGGSGSVLGSLLPPLVLDDGSSVLCRARKDSKLFHATRGIGSIDVKLWVSANGLLVLR